MWHVEKLPRTGPQKGQPQTISKLTFQSDHSVRADHSKGGRTIEVIARTANQSFARSTLVSELGCPVCGYPDFVAFGANGGSTYNVCPCCGCESGVDYNTLVDDERLTYLRKLWVVDEKSAWRSGIKPCPHGWNAAKQLRVARKIWKRRWNEDPDF